MAHTLKKLLNNPSGSVKTSAPAFIKICFPQFLQCFLLLCWGSAQTPAFSNKSPHQEQNTELNAVIHEVLISSLEETLLDYMRVSKELEAIRARDHALGITLLHSNLSDIQQRAIELLRETVDLRKQNNELINTIAELFSHLQNSGIADLDLMEKIASTNPQLTASQLSSVKSPSTWPTSPLQINVIAKDKTNGWFIANAGWDAGLIEGMIYQFSSSDGSIGKLRVIETRKNVCALIPQKGSPLPEIGQTLTLLTR